MNGIVTEELKRTHGSPSRPPSALQDGCVLLGNVIGSVWTQASEPSSDHEPWGLEHST